MARGFLENMTILIRFTNILEMNLGHDPLLSLLQPLQLFFNALATQNSSAQ